jgi:uncharacterized protein YndB with AHSA1/START domain
MQIRLWMWIVGGIVIGVPLLLFIVGSLVPRDHVARMTIDLSSPPDRVWGFISDVGQTKAWRSDISKVVITPNPGGPLRFTETTSNGDVPFELVSQDPPRRQVVRVIDDDQPFGGTWTWELAPTPAGTRLTLTEAGFVKNAFFRALGLIFFSPYDTLNGYLKSLAKALGDSAEPRRVD